MNFINRLKDEKIQHKLFQAFNVAYDRDFSYEMQFREDRALMTLSTRNR